MKRKIILLVIIGTGIFFSCSDLNDTDQEYTKAYVTLQGSDKIAVIDVDHVKLIAEVDVNFINTCLLYTSPSPRDKRQSRMPSSA